MQTYFQDNLGIALWLTDWWIRSLPVIHVIYRTGHASPLGRSVFLWLFASCVCTVNLILYHNRSFAQKSLLKWVYCFRVIPFDKAI